MNEGESWIMKLCIPLLTMFLACVACSPGGASSDGLMKTDADTTGDGFHTADHTVMGDSAIADGFETADDHIQIDDAFMGDDAESMDIAADLLVDMKMDTSDVLTDGASPCPAFHAGVSLGTVALDDLKEISGVVASRKKPGILWVHNDSGDSAQIYALSTSGKHLGTYLLKGVAAVDWEDIAADASHIYIGDIGDNAEERTSIVIYRVAEPEVTTDQEAVSENITEIESYPLKYPDRPHNAEAMFVDPISGDIYIVTKEQVDDISVFRAAGPHGNAQMKTMELIASFPIQSEDGPILMMTTGADISPSGDAILVRTYYSAYWWARVPGVPLGESFKGKACIVSLQYEQQGEAIGFDFDGLGYYTISEGSEEHIYYFEREGQ